ncbi:hypothetical protein MJO28_009171 [Puccinia striiformis f. sp. tritici]|uniref:Uncharacterized protein n=1 Tax=Puccinia striiformis f. sp. tritici TaxID=168172 RepID=A0ACC0E6Z4_9BASI|nr:hypothetical protein MJO29_016805 [Puccinia striiformis f. sp. tritici]KAI7947263.1 hypothetical protein MJO28_009171 [Puccinia striiformis f. sp. tritici]
MANPTPAISSISKKDEKDVIVIPTFNGTNYSNWQSTISAYLELKKLWYTCQSDVLSGEAISDTIKSNVLKVWLIFSSKITPDIFNSINSVCGRDPFKIWNKLKEDYAAANIYGIYRVWVNYNRITYEDDLLKYIIKIEAALTEMSTIGLDVMQELVSVSIMEKITHKRPALMERLLGDIDTLSNPFQLIAKLRQILNHDQVHKIKEFSSQSALATTTNYKKRDKPYPTCDGGKHNPDTKHKESECHELYPELKKKRRVTNYNTTTSLSKPPTEDYAYHTSDTTSGKNSVILDSGASQHMFNSLSFFSSSDPAHVFIVTGSGEENLNMIATRRGTALLKLSDNLTITLKNSLYVPNLSTNLVSFAQLIRDKADITAEGNQMKIILNGNHILRINTANNLFEIEGITTETALVALTVEAPSELTKWHQRLGHACAARIKTATGLSFPPGPRTLCATCVQGKMSRLPFKGHFGPTSSALEVVHGDLVGPITPTTNGGAKYFLTLVDQHTGFISINLLKEKSDATKAISGYKTFFEKQTGNQMKKLITDGGGEFCNKTLNEILEEEGIQHNVSPPYTPQHNGIAERANRTIIEMTRCMIIQANLALEWWGEAVLSAAATTNCLPSLSKSRASPFQLMLKQRPNLSFLRPFGCQAWVLKPKVNRDAKFDPISWEGTLVGYSNDLTSYRILRHEDQKIICSRQVNFNEHIFPKNGALSKSLDVSTLDASNPLSIPMPIFQTEQLLPFADSTPEDETNEENEDVENLDPATAVDNHPISPESGKRWKYVKNFQPSDPINSGIDESNILTEKRIRNQAYFVAVATEPKSHNMAMRSPDHLKWKEAELKEISNMKKHQVWIERARCSSDSPIASTWAYRRKLGADNQVIEYKARICAQGFRQTFGINFELKYAPTGKAASLRLLLSFAVNEGLQIHQLDVRSAFLTCPLEDTVTPYPPQGYPCKEGTIFELKRAIYGLKQASLVWYKRLSGFLTSIGFYATLSDPCVFHRPAKPSKPATWIYAHVDDLVIISSGPEIFKTEIESEFDIKYMGAAEFLLGMNIDRTQTGLHIHQTQYVERKIIEYGLDGCSPSSCPLNPRGHLKAATPQEIEELKSRGGNYRALVGSLNYLSVLTRPDISYAVSVLSQHLENPGIHHFRAAEQVFRYLSGTKQVGLVFNKEATLSISAHVDSDWGNCPDTRRSATGYVVLTNKQLLSWKASRQSTVSLSSTEAEYKALSDLGREISWISSLLSELFLGYEPKNIPVGVDNQGAIDLARSEISQNSFRTKHMNIRLHFVRELITERLIILKYIRTNNNSADFLTKPTGRCTIRRSLAAIGVLSISPSASRHEAQSNPGCHFSPSTPKSATKRRKGGARADKIHNETNSIISRVSTPPRQPHGNKGRIGSSTGTTIADLSILSRITAPPLTTRDSQLNHEQQSSS